jgi:hypothetical protein
MEGQGNQAPPTVAERRAWGKHARKRMPRGAVAGWRPPADRCDPVGSRNSVTRLARAAALLRIIAPGLFPGVAHAVLASLRGCSPPS